MRIVSIIHYPLLIRVVMTASFGLVMFGDWDYEYWLTIPEKFKETIMLNLIKDRFSSVHEIKIWLDQLGIPSEFSSY